MLGLASRPSPEGERGGLRAAAVAATLSPATAGDVDVGNSGLRGGVQGRRPPCGMRCCCCCTGNGCAAAGDDLPPSRRVLLSAAKPGGKPAPPPGKLTLPLANVGEAVVGGWPCAS